MSGSSSSSSIVYTTGGSTVTIDYNETLHLFLTEKEHLPFSAGKLLRMLDRRANEARVWQTGVGLRISVGDACCVLTQKATGTLAILYQRSRDLQVEFPCLLDLFAEQVQVGGMRS